MKIIFSRKGFDSSYGGCPSPIDQQTGKMMSFPIPGGHCPTRFSHIATPWGPMGALAAQLSKRPAFNNACAHLDPDLSPASVPRRPNWLASLGQVDAAQSHLAKQNVGVGDVFMFFGWFRPFLHTTSGASFVKGSRDLHAMFGYLQVGEMIQLGANPNQSEILKRYPWLHDHPHLHGTRSDNNTLYIASPQLSLGAQTTSLPGAGAFEQFSPSLALTAPGCSKSVWRVPHWLTPQAGISGLSYHADPDRWSRDDQGNHLLRSVAKGQEFVFDTHNHTPALQWISDVLHEGMNCDRRPIFALKSGKKLK